LLSKHAASARVSVVPLAWGRCDKSKMALTFIGKGPDVLPIPPGLELDPRRYVGSSAPTRAEQRPAAPTRLKIRYTVTDKDGRIKFEYADIEPVPEDCTVKGLISYLHESGPLQLQHLSNRTPAQLKYHGQLLDFEKRLDEYAIKNGAELQLVVKPKLADFAARAAGDSNVTRVRIVSHKLGMPTVIDGLTAETSVLEIKQRLSEHFKANPSWLVRGPVPPVTAGPRPPVTLQMTDGTNVELRVGDHLIRDGGAAAASGGKDKKGAGGMLRRVNGGPTNFPYYGEYLVEQAKADPELWPITIDLGETEEVSPEGIKTRKKNDPWLNLFHAGLPLKDDEVVGNLKILNDEQLFLNFFAPFDVPDPDPSQLKGGKDKGGKKKK